VSHGSVRQFIEAPPELRPVSLRFVDADLERRFQDQYLRDNLLYIRAAHVLAMAVWAAFWLYNGINLVVHYGFAIPVLVVSLALTYTRSYVRFWQPALVTVMVANSAESWMHHILSGHPPEWESVAGLMLILAFTYMFLRLQYLYAAMAAAIIIGYYNIGIILFPHEEGIGLLASDFHLVAFAVVGTAAAYALERFARLLFIRERELDRERERGDRLLRNILPDAIIDTLKSREVGLDPRYIAQGYGEVTVLFADLVGFTGQAARAAPADLVAALDEMFSRFDELADRFGLEKIKTVGDAYMAVAGLPQPRFDHVQAAAEMALAARQCIAGLRWPGGELMSVRIGIASGPVVAGVIGRRKFAYDIWGDTVNTASRLESHAAPGSIQVSELVYERLAAHYRFSEPRVVDLKGKGPTKARLLLERLATETAAAGVV
jgi:class 3 adenylate cyclase